MAASSWHAGVSEPSPPPAPSRDDPIRAMIVSIPDGGPVGWHNPRAGLHNIVTA
jgi:hypothetical protein